MTDKIAPDTPRYLVVNADDFGASHSVNQAALRAFHEGVLRSVSIMAAGAAFEEAALAARGLPGMSVGIHVTLVDGRSVLPPSEIPGLTDERGFFDESPARAGIRYWIHRRRLRGQLEAEIEAQFDRLEDACLRPVHADSHHHLHVHPVIFGVLCRVAQRRGVKWIRIPPGPFWTALDSLPAITEWAVFRALKVRNAGTAGARGLLSARTYGISRPGRVTEDYLRGLVSRIEGPVSEVFAHPDMDGAAGRAELEALTSPRVLEAVNSRGLTPAGFKDIVQKV
ncbi:MAG: ChbG/HpnK family deacetylase [Nitrospiraceae bacterium]|nr:ChbG/HpnK family deacetylase [Nitrospiraceae bacterium]